MKGEKIYLKAESILSRLYSESKLLSPDDKKQLYSEYIALLRKSAYLGYPQAQYDLGATYEDINFWGTNPHYDPYKCVYWYEKACEGNIADACNNLALLKRQIKKERAV